VDDFWQVSCLGWPPAFDSLSRDRCVTSAAVPLIVYR